MALLIPSPLKDQIHQAAMTAYPLECCGLMLGRIMPTITDAPENDDRQVTELVPAHNHWDASVQAVTDPQQDASSSGEPELDRHRRYWIDPEMMLKVQKDARDRNLSIIGVYHSHPDHPAMPSECDLRLAWPVYSYVIVSATGGQVADFRSWRLNDHHQFQAETVKIVNKISP
jgi:proteasome lid subunit RPN8/RPN11